MDRYYVINLEDVTKERKHPYTLVFKGFISTYGQNNKCYTFKYDGEIAFTDAMMPDDVREDFANQLHDDYGCGKIFDIKQARKQLEKKRQYRMKM